MNRPVIPLATRTPAGARSAAGKVCVLAPPALGLRARRNTLARVLAQLGGGRDGGRLFAFTRNRSRGGGLDPRVRPFFVEHDRRNVGPRLAPLLLGLLRRALSRLCGGACRWSRVRFCGFHNSGGCESRCPPALATVGVLITSGSKPKPCVPGHSRQRCSRGRQYDRSRQALCRPHH
jgi:hypothetical protein